jgi:hypothetical protein
LEATDIARLKPFKLFVFSCSVPIVRVAWEIRDNPENL